MRLRFADVRIEDDWRLGQLAPELTLVHSISIYIVYILYRDYALTVRRLCIDLGHAGLLLLASPSGGIVSDLTCSLTGSSVTEQRMQYIHNYCDYE